MSNLMFSNSFNFGRDSQISVNFILIFHTSQSNTVQIHALNVTVSIFILLIIIKNRMELGHIYKLVPLFV